MPEVQILQPDVFGKPIIWVSYCPDLGIYQVHKEEGDDEADVSDAKYDRFQMEKAIETLMRMGEPEQAAFLSRMATTARAYPHYVIVFFATGKTRICRSVPPPDVELEERRDNCQQFESWLSKHSGGDGVVVAPEYPSRFGQG